MTSKRPNGPVVNSIWIEHIFCVHRFRGFEPPIRYEDCPPHSTGMHMTAFGWALWWTFGAPHPSGSSYGRSTAKSRKTWWPYVSSVSRDKCDNRYEFRKNLGGMSSHFYDKNLGSCIWLNQEHHQLTRNVHLTVRIVERHLMSVGYWFLQSALGSPGTTGNFFLFHGPDNSSDGGSLCIFLAFLFILRTTFNFSLVFQVLLASLMASWWLTFRDLSCLWSFFLIFLT